MTQGGYPGIGRATAGLVRALLATQTPHHFLLLYRSDRPVPRAIQEALRPPHRVLPLQAPLRSAADQVVTPLRLHQARVDLLHSTYYAVPLAPGLPYLLNVFDLIPERYPHYWSRPQSFAIRRWLHRASTGATRIFAPSQATATDLARIYRIPEARMVITPLAVDGQWLSAMPCSPGSPATPPFLLCVCTNKPHKNLVRLVEAYASLTLRHAHLPDLVIAGGWDPRYPQARSTATDLGVDHERRGADRGRVRFVHNPDDAALHDLYRHARGFIFPSEYEGFGLPVLEAMVAGLPVAASTTPAVAEVAGDACIGFDPLDPDAIARAIALLAFDDDLCRRYALLGQARAKAFSWSATARQTLAAYDEALCG